VSNDSSTPPPDQGTLAYIGPLWPLTLENFERLSDEQRVGFWWTATFVADQSDELVRLLWAAGIDP
jgi:hypothetical protein